jgi:hypothetical protein
MRFTTLATIAGALLCVLALGQPSPPTAEVMKIDEQFRLAKLHRDTGALASILAEDFHEINQNGNTRDKAQTIALWSSFAIDSLKTESADVKITGDTAVVRGSQTEHNGGGVDRMLYMRVYVRRGAGWQLLAAAQFRDPRLAASSQ